MNISKKSWHYVLYRYLRNFYEDGPTLPFHGERLDYRPKSLCSYFWAIVLMLFALPVIVVAILPAVVVAMGVAELIVKYRSWRRARCIARGLPPKSEKPSLVISFVKAQKQKRCPLITLTDR